VNDKDTIFHSSIKTDYSAKFTGRNGKIKFELIGTDHNQCNSSQIFEVLAGGPYADIFNYNTRQCDSIYVDINLLNKSKDITFISWNYKGKEIGNQNFTNLLLPYNIENTITVKLADIHGCKSTITKKIYVQKKINANFSSDTTGSFCPPLEVYFQNLSTSQEPIAEYEWDFGDGTYSYLENPGKLYLVPGKFTVTLTITDIKGCKSTKIAPDFILVNGPTGSYSFAPNEGCSPLNVKFKSTSQNAEIIKWDLGDGKVLNGANQELTYDRIGQYIPLLILEDKFGCSYTMPPIDTINVRGFPITKFQANNTCFGEKVRFSNETDSSEGTITSYYWDFGDGNNSNIKTPRYTFTSGKKHQISLIATNKFNCIDTLTKTINLFEPIAKIDFSKKQYCLGENIGILNKSSSDTTIKEYNWLYANKEISKEKTPQFTADKVGNHSINLEIMDDAGCKDTINLPNTIGVGDTIAPLPPLIYRASVLNDNSIDITFKKDSIVDFFKYELFREIGANSFTKISEIIDQSDTTIYDNGINTLHQSHCFVVSKENICRVKTDLSKLKKHCTIEATALGGFNKIDLDWNPYLGWNEVDSYYVYRQERLYPDSFTQIAKLDGNTFGYTDTSLYCRVEMTYKILAKQQNNLNTQWSWSDTTKAKPIYENVVPPNEIWRTTVVDDEYTSLDWLPITTNIYPIAFYKIAVKEGEGDYKELPENIDPGLRTFDYLKTKVDYYNYHFQMYAVDVCEDKSATSIPAKTVLLNVQLSEAFRPSLTWTKYQGWAEGVDEYVVELQDEFGVFLEIGRTAGEDTFMIDDVSPFNCIESYCYRITAIRNQPFNFPDSTHSVISHSNIDCAPVESKIFVPNAFTINSDNLNEEFTVKGIYIKEYNIKLFNRWGEKVYDSNSFKENWDGTHEGKDVSQNVFVYLIEAKGVDNKLYHLSGDVTLLR